MRLLSMKNRTPLQKLLMLSALSSGGSVVEDTATGNPVTFETDLARPLKSLLIPFTPVQSGSGDPSPQNVRPIVPWNGLKVYHSGADTSEYTETDISFPSPVYWGEHEAVSGKLMSFYALLTKNTAEMNNNEDYPGWKNSGVENIIGTGVNELLRNVLTNVSPVSSLSVGANTAYDGDVLYLNKSYFNKTQSEWKTLAIDIQILVPLATPQEITLTPEQITALKGENTIWSDADGDIEVTYYKKG